MSTTEEKRARYIVACVNEFAEKKKLDRLTSFRYLYNNRGIEFLKNNYDIEHTLAIDEAVDDLTIICRNHGGAIE